MQENTFSNTDIGVSITQGCLIVPLTIDFYDEVLAEIQQKILESVYETHPKGVVIDISRLKTTNSYIFSMITDSVRMISLLGVPSIIIGIQPGVAATLVELEINITDLDTAQNLEQAIEHLLKMKKR